MLYFVHSRIGDEFIDGFSHRDRRW